MFPSLVSRVEIAEPCCQSTEANSWLRFCQLKGPNMKKSLIIVISAMCIVAASATMAVATTTTPKSEARSTVSGALSASSGSRRPARLLRW